jgi:hypothetical protein
MKCLALGPFGYWQSRRNRFDLFVTVLGLIWIFLHFISFGKKDLVNINLSILKNLSLENLIYLNFIQEETSNSFGFIVIVLRFFTIAGKHVKIHLILLFLF